MVPDQTKMLSLGFTNSESEKFFVMRVFSICWFAMRFIRLIVVGVLTETQILRHPCTKYIYLMFLSIFPLLGSEAQCLEGDMMRGHWSVMGELTGNVAEKGPVTTPFLIGPQ